MTDTPVTDAASEPQNLDSSMYVGRWWETQDSRVNCNLCPRHCTLAEGQRGFCFVRQNVGGKLRLTTYGKSTGFCIDPIEKKPLNHFLPGTATLSFGTAGCNLGCKFCQNWDISKSRSVEILSSHASPDQIVQAALDSKCRSIAFTYNDPVIWAEYAIDTATEARRNGLKTVAVTAGYITAEARKEFFAAIDAANVDLKAFSETFYNQVTLSHLEPVKETLRWLAHETDIWFEITNLVIPGLNDSYDELKRMSHWVASELSPNIPIHFTAFHPDYKLRDRPSTPTELLTMAQDVAKAEGLRFVYIGNCHEPDRQSTYCPECGGKLIERDWYQLGSYRLEGDRCKFCRAQIPGVFEKTAGDWGPRRMLIQIGSRDETSLRPAPLTPPTETEFFPDMKTIEDVVGVRTAFTASEQNELLEYARQLIRSELHQLREQVQPPHVATESSVYGLFLTLNRGPLLRGCRGYWGATAGMALQECLLKVVRDTVLSDPRFPRIGREEYEFCEIELSILHSPREYLASSRGDLLREIIPGKHGLVILHPNGRGLLLPQVAADHGWDTPTFLVHLCDKAGLGPEAWRDATLISFEATHFALPPQRKEVVPFTIENIAQSIQSLKMGQLPSDHPGARAALGAHFGIEIEMTDGKRCAAFSDTEHPLELISRESPSPASGAEIRTVRLLCYPIDIEAEDYPERLRSYRPYVAIAAVGDSTALSLPGSAQDDTILRALHALKITHAQWLRREARVRIYFAFEVYRADTAPIEARIRPPAVAGQFYPADQNDCERELSRFVRPADTDESVFGLLLPHAGWNYCGEILGAVISRTKIPNRVIILSPKHTPYGPLLSVSSSVSWRLPTQDVAIDRELATKITAEMQEIQTESEAHREEHGIEVIVPFLVKRNPAISIVPIVIGSIRLPEAISLGERIAKLLNPETLLVISSDMNHFDSEDITREKDRAALAAIEAKQPELLYQECTARQISMCGLLPCVIGLTAMNKNETERKLTYSVDVVRYGTSSAFSGDTSRTVGYAGIQFKETR